jgi:hypothetical protein
MLIAKPISGKVIESIIPEMTFLVFSREEAVITDVETICITIPMIINITVIVLFLLAVHKT